MKIDIPSKDMVKKMVDDAIRKEMNKIYELLDRFRKRLIDVEEKVKNQSHKIKGIKRNE